MDQALHDQATKVVLLAFSDGHNNAGAVPASEIFDHLIRQSVWYVPRCPRNLADESIVLFYQAGAGIRAYAKVTGVFQATDTDQNQLRRYGLYHLSIKLTLRDIVIFPTPVTLQPIVQHLDFVSNKKYWGHALRSTPRSISIADFKRILSFAGPRSRSGKSR
jgi:hypothetical protein